MKILIPKKKYLFLIFLFSFLLLPLVSSAALRLNLEYPSFTVGGETFDLNTTQHLNQVVVWFYYFIVAVAGFAAFVMLVWGGAEWLVSAGNPTRISSARERITSAITGLLIILVSFLILQTINPELTTLTFPETQESAPWPSPPDNGTEPEEPEENTPACADENGACTTFTYCFWLPGHECHNLYLGCTECCCIPKTDPDPDPDPGPDTCWWNAGGDCKTKSACGYGYICNENKFECTDCCCRPLSCQDFLGECRLACGAGEEELALGSFNCGSYPCCIPSTNPDPDPDPEPKTCQAIGGTCKSNPTCQCRGDYKCHEDRFDCAVCCCVSKDYEDPYVPPYCPVATKCEEVGGFGGTDCLSTEECNNFGMICDELGPFECPECCCRPL